MELKIVAVLDPIDSFGNIPIAIHKIVSDVDGYIVSDKEWRRVFARGDDINQPLTCRWIDDTESAQVLLDEETKTAILAKWAE